MKKENNSLPAVFNEAQVSLISGKTPDKYIKRRVGVGGRAFDYVEIGYVIDQLNKLTGFRWSFRIVDQQIGKSQIWVKGRLTLYTEEGKIIKEQYGSKIIAKYKGTDNIIDIGADLKAAASDSLKKCASLVGIAQDIYWKQVDEEIGGSAYRQHNPPQNVASKARGAKNIGKASDKQVGLIFKLLSEKKISKEEIKKRAGVKSFKNMTTIQASKIIEELLK